MCNGSYVKERRDLHSCQSLGLPEDLSYPQGAQLGHQGTGACVGFGLYAVGLQLFTN